MLKTKKEKKPTSQKKTKKTHEGHRPNIPRHPPRPILHPKWYPQPKCQRVQVMTILHIILEYIYYIILFSILCISHMHHLFNLEILISGIGCWLEVNNRFNISVYYYSILFSFLCLFLLISFVFDLFIIYFLHVNFILYIFILELFSCFCLFLITFYNVYTDRIGVMLFY